MRVALIGGSGMAELAGVNIEETVVKTKYGPVVVGEGTGENRDLVFLARHGPSHTVPPHRVNYRANVKALHDLGVKRVAALCTVGSLRLTIPPGSVIVLDQLLDFTHGRESTFFDGEDNIVAHTEFTDPFCSGLRDRILQLAQEAEWPTMPNGTYACFNGPRLETAAEIRMYAQLGGDVVGMTLAPEAQLAREVGLHYAAIAISTNWAAGLKGPVVMEKEGLLSRREAVQQLLMTALRRPIPATCNCESAVTVVTLGRAAPDRSCATLD